MHLKRADMIKGHFCRGSGVPANGCIVLENHSLNEQSHFCTFSRMGIMAFYAEKLLMISCDTLDSFEKRGNWNWQT